MTAITALSASGPHTLSADFDGVVVDAGPGRWWITPTGGGAAVAIVEAVIDATGQGVALSVEPGMSPGEDYNVAPVGVLDAAGDPTTGSVTITAPLVNLAHPGEGFPRHILEVLMGAIGEEVQEVAGAPTTLLTRDWSPDDDALFVEGTVGFVGPARLWVAGRVFEFEEVDASGRVLLQAREVNPKMTPVRRGEVVVLDAASILPD